MEYRREGGWWDEGKGGKEKTRYGWRERGVVVRKQIGKKLRCNELRQMKERGRRF